MALFIRLRSVCVYEKFTRLALVPRTYFHSLSKVPKYSPPAGARSFFGWFTQTRRDMMKADDIPDHFAMIYRNRMSKYIVGAQIISAVTGGMVLMSLLLKAQYNDTQRDTFEWSPTAAPVENEEICYLLGFTLIIMLVQMLVVRTPIRIYKVPKTSKYIVVNYGNYFFGKERHTFQGGQIFRGQQEGMLPWSENRYVIETNTYTKPVLLVEYFFQRPADLHIMLGEQRDPDLEEQKDPRS